MADANNIPHIPPPHPKVYFGKRENQRDPHAIRQLPRPNPSEGPFFAQNITVTEKRKTYFTPSAPALIEISRQTFARLLIDDVNLNKVLLPEYFDYYSVAMLWLRIVFLKLKNSQPLTGVEIDVIRLAQPARFYVPEPILQQLQHLGNTQTMTKQHLYPEFPPLPSKIVAGFPGYYGPILIGEAANPNIHNLYEEIPCLGVVAEAVRQALSDAAPGPYRSSLDIDELNRVNNNLLGYKPLLFRRNEAKILAHDFGMTHSLFPCYPETTGFNIDFLISISNVLSKTKTFRLTKVDFSKTLTEAGFPSQAIISRPLVKNGQTNLKSETRATSLSGEADSHFGSAIFFATQLMKEPGPNGDDTTWCCMNVNGGTPKIWIDNRNQRRNLPAPYMYDGFQCISLNAQMHRINIIGRMVINKG